MRKQKSKVKNQGRKREETLVEFARRMNKIGFHGPRDLAYNLDHYLYGAPKKKLPKELMKESK